MVEEQKTLRTFGILLRSVQYLCPSAPGLYSLAQWLGSRMSGWSSPEPLCLWGMRRWTGRRGQTTYWLHRSIPFVILAHETLPNFSTSKIIWNSLLTWGWGFRLFRAACSDRRQCKDTAERTLQGKAKKSSVCQKVELKGLPWEL